MAMLGGEPGQRPTERRPFAWRPQGDFEEWKLDAVRRGRASGLSTDMARQAAHRFGRRIDDLLRLIEAQPELAQPIVPGLSFCRAELLFAQREEMACTQEDILRRRVPVAILSREAVALDATLSALPA